MSVIDTTDPMSWLKKPLTEEHKMQLHRALALYYVDEDIEPKKQQNTKVPIKKLLPYL